MNAAPLNLQAYFFKKLAMEVNEDYSSEDDRKHADQELNLTLDFRAEQDVETGHLYRLQLGLRNLTGKEAALPYDIDAILIGYFAINVDEISDELDRIIQINGASILYAAAREQILTITGRGPHRALKLPAISFATIVDKHKAENSEKAITEAEK